MRQFGISVLSIDAELDIHLSQRSIKMVPFYLMDNRPSGLGKLCIHLDSYPLCIQLGQRDEEVVRNLHLFPWRLKQLKIEIPDDPGHGEQHLGISKTAEDMLFSICPLRKMIPLRNGLGNRKSLT